MFFSNLDVSKSKFLFQQAVNMYYWRGAKCFQVLARWAVYFNGSVFTFHPTFGNFKMWPIRKSLQWTPANLPPRFSINILLCLLYQVISFSSHPLMQLSIHLIFNAFHAFYFQCIADTSAFPLKPFCMQVINEHSMFVSSLFFYMNKSYWVWEVLSWLSG